MRVNGLRKKSKVSPILGFSDAETVKIDFDETSFSTVKYWALRAMKWFRLKGCVILKSSKKCYHVVFDHEVSWSENMRIVAWVSLQSHSRSLCKWFLMQCIKGCSTLRVSPKCEKPSPRIVYRCGEQGHSVKDFLENRKIIKQISQKLRKKRCF